MGAPKSRRDWSTAQARLELQGPSLQPPKLTQRPCLCCRRTFASEGAHHRMCDRCKRGDRRPRDSDSY